MCQLGREMEYAEEMDVFDVDLQTSNIYLPPLNMYNVIGAESYLQT
jgi:hypothetical protein